MLVATVPPCCPAQSGCWRSGACSGARPGRRATLASAPRATRGYRGTADFLLHAAERGLDGAAWLGAQRGRDDCRGRAVSSTATRAFRPGPGPATTRLEIRIAAGLLDHGAAGTAKRKATTWSWWTSTRTPIRPRGAAAPWPRRQGLIAVGDPEDSRSAPSEAGRMGSTASRSAAPRRPASPGGLAADLPAQRASCWRRRRVAQELNRTRRPPRPDHHHQRRSAYG
jgi:hypothetical protein